MRALVRRLFSELSRSGGINARARLCGGSQHRPTLGRALRASYRERLSQNKKRVGHRWRLDETYIKIKGECKYLNNIVEQDHRFIKRITRPMLGFKSFWSARATLAGIELWRMLKKGQNKSSLPAWEQFYVLALAG